MNKPDELQIRTDAFFRAQMVLHEHTYPLDEKIALNFLRKLFSEDRESFWLNYRRMCEMGYKGSWLSHELFKSNSKMSRVKRTAYVSLMARLRK